MIDEDEERSALREVLDGRLVRPAFQPIVDLDSGAVVGYEALARVPGGPLDRPDDLFRAGRAAGRLIELDWLCREAAVEMARSAGMRYPLSLFVNAEPETLLASQEDADRWGTFGDLRCYAELTERALTARPAALLRAIDQIREQDWGIALDDVGVDPQSLALLPLVRPDVVKLDLRLLQQRPSSDGDIEIAQVLHSALAQAADTGAVVIAEGVETEQQHDLARACGAQYAQGYLLGRPLPLPVELHSPSVAMPLVRRALDRHVLPAPFAVLGAEHATRSADRGSVLEIARQLLARALHLDPAPLVLVCVSDPDLLPPMLAGLLSRLAAAPVVGVVGSPPVLSALEGLGAVGEPGAVGGLRTAPLQDGDPARDDFDIIVVSSFYAAALSARPSLPLRPDGPLDMLLTFDREAVCQAGEAVLRRLP